MRLVLAAAAFGLAFIATPAAARPARCVIQMAGESTWRGACNFRPDGGGGSFSIDPAHGTFQSGIGDISVSLISPGVAEVRGNTAEGINSRWGEARRSRRDPACWVGEDFSVCVY
jgi:hypothetical protein